MAAVARPGEISDMSMLSSPQPARHRRMTLAARAAISAFALVTGLAACRPGATPISTATAADSALIRRDVTWLADDAREGRGTGTAGNAAAAAYVAARFAALGLTPLACASACPDGWFQPFTARVIARQRAGLPFELPARNVVGLVRGTDPALRDEYVVIGGHYDHLGRDTLGALDPDARDAVRNGADDNASGTVAVLELARLVARQPLKRTAVFVAFSGEELGLLGSQHFVDAAPIPLARVQAMFNFDMVGRLDREQLQVFGTATAAEFAPLLDETNRRFGFRLTATGDGFGRSDHASFYAKDIPVLHFFTGTHADYHRASDDAARINAAGEAKVIDFAMALLREVGDRPARLTFVRAAAPVAAQPRAGRGAYLGSIPDMAAGDGTGLRLTGVRAGSPADVSGLKADDVIVEFGGKPVTDLYAYTDAIAAFAPGDTVQVVVRRAGQRVPLTVVLGRRGS